MVDSLLDYYSQEDIERALVTNYPGSNKFKELSILSEHYIYLIDIYFQL